jgi:hypothetical protein
MMNTELLPLGLVLHLAGITMMVGTFLAGFFSSRILWNYLPNERDKALVVSRATSRFALLQMTGGLMIVAGGILMMTAVHGVFMQQLWFKVKMGLLGLLILNAVVTARPAARNLRRLLAGRGELTNDRISAMIQRLRIFYWLQLGLFLTIIVLSAFKFN